MLKICRLRIKGYRQFEDTDLDFTDPQTGEPADRICFIGPNGTGKSTILELLAGFLSGSMAGHTGGELAFKIQTNGRRAYIVPEEAYGDAFSVEKELMGRATLVLDEYIDNCPDWHRGLGPDGIRSLADHQEEHVVARMEAQSILREVRLAKNASDLLVYSPPEAQENGLLGVKDVPRTTVSNALALRKNIPFRHEVSNASVVQMWTHLVYLLKLREEEREAFERREDNLDRSKRELIEAFDSAHPSALDGLARLWDHILAPAGLEFDVEGASNPIQLTDNLKAYIRHKETKERVAYSQLSTGIRNFMFRVGHIYLLYFNRRIARGFVLIDEPENSLFPDFLFELVKIYDEIVAGSSTQMFFATHNPIIAAQFEPHERILLEFDDHGSVHASKGVAPKGDDPNDVLEQDFRLTHLMGEAGLRAWQEYLDLRKKLRRSQDEEEKLRLVAEAAELARKYSFPGPDSKP